MLLGAVLLHGTWMVDVAIIYALLSYVGTLYIARVMRKD
jgi:multisubunit Na+/H+ antiporter MnhF subunit